jgi:hypothetical protein
MAQHRRKRLEKRTIKLYMGITLVCFLLAALLYFFVDKGSQLMEEVNKIAGIELDPATLKKLKTVYQEKLDANEMKGIEQNRDQTKNATELEKVMQDYRKKISDDELEKLKQEYKERSESKR